MLENVNSSFMKDLVQKLKKKKNRCCCIYLTMTLKYNWDSIIWYMITNVSMTLWLLFFAFPLLKKVLFSQSLLSLSLISKSLMPGALSKNLLKPFFFFFSNVNFHYQRANYLVLCIKMFYTFKPNLNWVLIFY